MRVSLPTLRLLLGMLTFLLLTACGDGGSSSSSTSTSEINTLNLYFTKNEIRSFNSVTGENTWRANYNEGENTLLTLNTDNDKQGHEFVVYVDDGTIKIMDYLDASSTGIATYNTNDEICIFPRVTAAQNSFEGDTKGERILIDQTSILVTQKENGICSKESEVFNRIDFTLGSENDHTVTEVNSSHLLGDTLLDFAHRPTSSEDKPGRYGFLGYDKIGGQLHLYNSEGATIWETALSNTSPVNAPPIIQQVTKKEVLIQQNGVLYLNDIAALFDIASTDTTTIPNIPQGSQVAALFENKELNLKLTDTELEKIEFASNGTIFALVDDGAVYLKKQNQTQFQTEPPLAPKDNSVKKLDIKMTDNGTLVVHRTFSSQIHIRLENFVNNNNPTPLIPLSLEINGEELIVNPDTDFEPDALKSVINNNINLQNLKINATSNETYLDIRVYTDENIQVEINGTGYSIDVSEFNPHANGSPATNTQTVHSEQDIVVEPTLPSPLETLARINTNSNTPASITEADKIIYETLDNNIYINTLTNSDWQAVWLNENFERTTYENSIFVFAKNSRSASLEKNIFLISPVSTDDLNGEQINPKLYEFDEANTTTGRKQIDSKDFVFGEFSVDIREVSDSEVVNDIFGRLHLKSTRSIDEVDTNVIETYYFNPSETESHIDGEANKALQRISCEKENKALQPNDCEEEII